MSIVEQTPRSRAALEAYYDAPADTPRDEVQRLMRVFIDTVRRDAEVLTPVPTLRGWLQDGLELIRDFHW